MTPLTAALMNAIEVKLASAKVEGKEGFIDLVKSPGLRDAFLDAPEGTLYLELDPDRTATRALWAELLEAGAQPPMTAITPGDGNGVAVLLCPDGIEMYVISDNPEEGTLIAQLSPEAGKAAKWSFQRG